MQTYAVALAHQLPQLLERRVDASGVIVCTAQQPKQASSARNRSRRAQALTRGCYESSRRYRLGKAGGNQQASGARQRDQEQRHRIHTCFTHPIYSPIGTTARIDMIDALDRIESNAARGWPFDAAQGKS